MSTKNDITGDSITTKVGNNLKYSEGWDRIFSKNGEKNVRYTERRVQESPRKTKTKVS
jgi:hypothetical protein